MNKNILFLVTLFAITSISFSQRNLSYNSLLWQFDMQEYDSYQTYSLLREKENLKEHLIKSREKIKYYKGEPISTIEHFDTEGRITYVERTSRKHKRYTSTILYNANGKIVQSIRTNFKNEKSTTTYKYDLENRLLERITRDYKNEYYGVKFKYDQNGNTVYRRIYEKDEITPKKELVYTYYENGDKKTTNYFEKGKLKHSWKFDCKPEGELINVKTKEISTICISEELDKDGNRVVWEREFDEDGDLRKYKTVYTPDSLILLKQVYNSENKVSYQTDYIYNENKKIVKSEITRFGKDGESRLSSERFYHGLKGSKTIYYDKKGKVYRTDEYIADENGIPIKGRKSGKWGYTTLYNYQDGLKKSEVRIYKSQTVVEEYVYRYY